MACDDEYVIPEDHAQQQQQQRHHSPQPSAVSSSRFGTKVPPSLLRVSLDPSSSAAVKKPSVDDSDEFAGGGFSDPKCLPPSFHDAIVFQDDAHHPFPGTGGEEEEEDEDDQKLRGRPEKRKDRDELSDGGTMYCYKKTKPDAGAGCGADYKKDREEWSDSAIACLLDAYTEKYVQLNRGNLRGRDWNEVASVVSDRCNKQKSCKSVEQCKNKVDNLKKRYKA